MHVSRWFCCLLAALAAGVSARQFEISVTGREAGLKLAIVSAPVPEDFPADGWLRNAKGDVPYQRSGDSVIFIARGLQAGEVRRFRVEEGAAPAAALAREEKGRVYLTDRGRPVLIYQGRETELPRPEIKPVFQRGGYIHPVFSPGGRQVTDDYPPNHIHHHGIWFPWTKTVFESRQPDFWNMGEGTGKVEFSGLDAFWQGPVHAGFSARHRFIDLTAEKPKAALDETWSVTAYAPPGADYFVFDLVSTQTCASASVLRLPKYHYGGLGFRGNWAWNGAGKCFFLTSNGETDRVKGNETRGNWCHIGGEADGALTGIAVLCHPDNFRAPQPMRLHPDEPFFCFAPGQAGDWAIEPGRPYVSRYRFVVKDGPPDKDELDAHWAAYARPPLATVTAR